MTSPSPPLWRASTVTTAQIRATLAASGSAAALATRALSPTAALVALAAAALLTSPTATVTPISSFAGSSATAAFFTA